MTPEPKVTIAASTQFAAGPIEPCGVDTLIRVDAQGHYIEISQSNGWILWGAVRLRLDDALKLAECIKVVASQEVTTP